MRAYGGYSRSELSREKEKGPEGTKTEPVVEREVETKADTELPVEFESELQLARVVGRRGLTGQARGA